MGDYSKPFTCLVANNSIIVPLQVQTLSSLNSDLDTLNSISSAKAAKLHYRPSNEITSTPLTNDVYLVNPASSASGPREAFNEFAQLTTTTTSKSKKRKLSENGAYAPPSCVMFGGLRNIALVRPHETIQNSSPPVFHQTYGTYPHANILNPALSYGNSLQSASTDSSCYVLKPSVELLMSVENRGGGENTSEPATSSSTSAAAINTSVRRTQIVDVSDSSYITSVCLGLLPGHTLIESGTGSCMFTLQCIRAVNARISSQNQKGNQTEGYGKVHTYEFNRERKLAAERDLLQHGLITSEDNRGNVTAVWSDACDTSGDNFISENSTEISHGFPVPHHPKLTQHADAIFLDLPEPWVCIMGAQVS